MNQHVAAPRKSDAEAVITYGRTLTRPMTDADVMAYLETLDSSRAFATLHIAFCHSHVPGIINVEAWRDNIAPASALVGLEVAAKRLRSIHGLGSGPLRFVAVDLYDAEHMRARAEAVVDMCRSSRVGTDGRHYYDHTRERCVQTTILQMANASEG